MLVAVPAMATTTGGALIEESHFFQFFSERIIEATVNSTTFTAPDPFTAPLTSDPVAALIALGSPVPPNPVFAFLFLQTFVNTTTITQVTTSPDAIFIGTLDDPTNLVILQGIVHYLYTTTETTVDGYRLTATSGEAAAIPEPSSLALVSTGTLFAFLRRRCRG